jgi:hypothetical protein
MSVKNAAIPGYYNNVFNEITEKETILKHFVAADNMFTTY